MTIKQLKKLLEAFPEDFKIKAHIPESDFTDLNIEGIIRGMDKDNDPQNEVLLLMDFEIIEEPDDDYSLSVREKLIEKFNEVKPFELKPSIDIDLSSISKNIKIKRK